MRRRRVILLTLVVVAGFTAVGIVAAQDEIQFVRGEPDLDMYVAEPEVAPGSATQLNLQVANRGRISLGATTNRDIVTAARGVSVEITDTGPFEVSTREHSIGTVHDGDVREVPIMITVPEDVEPGEYEIDVRLRYRHTSQYSPGSGVVNERSRSVRTSVDVFVDDGARFALRTVDSDVQVGDRGTFETELTNVGGEPARDITLKLDSTTSDVLLGEGSQNTARIDRLEPGENTTLSFDATMRQDVSARNVTLTGHVGFTDPDGVSKTQDGLSTGLRPTDEQTFTLDVETSTLRVGELGRIDGMVTNDGPQTAENVVLSLGETQIEPRSRSYAVGDLAPGESASFQFRGTVPLEADAVPQRLDVTTAYRTPAGNDRSTTSPIRVEITERRDAIDVRPINATFAAGETGSLELELTNQRDGSISDVRVHLGVEDPLDSDFRTTVISSLGPGESDRVAFDLEVDSDAPISSYPATVEIEYLDPDDEVATIRPVTVAVDVIESDDGLFPALELLIFGVLVVLAAAVFVWLYRR